MLPALIGALGRVGMSAAARGQAAAAANYATAARSGGKVPLNPPKGAVDKFTGGLEKFDQGLDKLTAPMRAADQGLDKITGVLGKASTAAADFATKPLQMVDKGFKLVTDGVSKAGTVVVDYATKPLDLLTKGLNAINAPVLKAVGTLTAFRDAVTAVGNALAQFTQLANPAITQRFRFASDDLTASIGRALLPAMQFATKATRAFADVVFTLSGPFQRLGSAVFKPLGEAADAVLAALSPVVRMFGRLVDLGAALLRPFTALGAALLKFSALGTEGALAGMEAVFTPMIEGLTAVAIVLGKGADAFGRMVDGAIKRIRAFLGLPKSIADASAGAAVRNVGLTSVESYQNKAITSAFGLGTASTEERTAKGVEDMVKILERLPQHIWEYVKALPALAAAELAQLLAQLLPKAPSLPGLPAVGAGVPTPPLPDLGTLGRDAGRWLASQANRFSPLGGE